MEAGILVSTRRKLVSVLITLTGLAVLFFISINTGSIDLTLGRLIKGLFAEYDEAVAVVYDLRFPRIFIAMLGGAAMSVSGVILQAVMKNPLADAGIIGISSGSSFAALLVLSFFPQLYYSVPVFSFLGGVTAFAIIYALSWKSGLQPLRIILVGIALNAFFTGVSSVLDSMAASSSGVTSMISSGVSMKTWDDVKMMLIYVPVGLVIALLSAEKCNLLALEDKTIRSLGINVTVLRVLISLIAVMLSSISTAVIGVIAFIGLIVPHIARLLVGSNHRILIPYTAILGAFVFLFADTLGRTVAAPYEINPAVVMSVAGGPFFIVLLMGKKGDRFYGK